MVPTQPRAGIAGFFPTPPLTPSPFLPDLDPEYGSYISRKNSNSLFGWPAMMLFQRYLC